MTRPGFLRPAALLVILVMAGIAAVGFFQTRKDLEDLRTISQDNILWSATQMELELLRLHREVALYALEQSPEALEDLRLRLDILWSRIDLMTSGRVGALLREYDAGYGTLETLENYLVAIDPVILGLEPGDVTGLAAILDEIERLQQDLRIYILRVVRGDTAAASQIRARMQQSAQVTAGLGLAALLVSILSLALIMRDNQRQRLMAAMNLRHAEDAEAASRAKSRFLTMMSHELRNPLNGILGPLALLRQTPMEDKYGRLIDKAQQSGRAMLRMLRGLLDYSDIQDEQLVLKREPFRPHDLADEVRTALNDLPAEDKPQIAVEVAPSAPELMWGDADRIAQIFINLAEYLLQPHHAPDLRISFAHDGKNLIGDIAFGPGDSDVDWKLDLLTGMRGDDPQALTTDALGPLIARCLLAAAQGVLTLPDPSAGCRKIRVVIPGESVSFEKMRVHLETRSSALETIYRAALKSERVEFVPRGTAGTADIVLVDATSVGEQGLMGELRSRFPNALFVSLGSPTSPAYFDDIVETPHDMTRLRKSVLGRLA